MTDINLLPKIDALTDDLVLIAINPNSGVTGNFTVGELKTYFGATGGTPTPATRELAYSTNGDENDLFYDIGTAGKTALWQNPHVTGLITVAASSVLGGQSPIETLVSRTGAFFHTGFESNPWIQFVLPATSRLSLKRWSYLSRSNDTQFIPSRLLVSISLNGIDYQQIDDRSFSLGVNQWFTSPELLSIPEAKIIRFTLPATSYFTAGRFQLYGTYKP